MAIISNVDDHLLFQTIKQLGVPFEVMVTSQQTKSYKPDRAIFDRAVKLIGEHPSTIIHIAEERCEVTPARALGMRSIWSIGLRDLTMEATRNRMLLFQI